MSFLEASEMTGGYGAADILHGCTLTVEKGQIAVIVGPNGAGKSTAMKAVFGMLRLRGGHVLLEGEDITRLTPQERVRKGMGFVPQVNNVFPTMSVQENLEMGAFIRTDDFRDTMETSSRSCATSATKTPESFRAGNVSRWRWAVR